MAQTFIAHSRKDEKLRDFFARIFSSTHVKGVFEEFEKITRNKVSSEQISRDIELSNAVFVLLSNNVQNIPHTRDWVVWETGVAKNKDIWVFEPYQELGNISVVIPYLRHYVLYDTNDDHFRYIKQIIESYDDSEVLPTVVVATAVGAILDEIFRIGPVGKIFGGLTGLALSQNIDKPQGVKIKCTNCNSIYNVHLPEEINTFRCPVCNSFLEIIIN